MAKPAGYSRCQTVNITAVDQQPDYSWGYIDVYFTEDGYMREALPNDNYGSAAGISTGNQTANRFRSALEVDLTSALSGLPSGYELLGADLMLYYYAYYINNASARTIDVQQLGLPASIEEAYLTWNNYKDSTAWPGGAGGKGDVIGTAVSLSPLGSFGTKVWDIFSMVQTAISTYSNKLRLLLFDHNETGSTMYLPSFRSSENDETEQRPFVRLYYRYDNNTTVDDKIVEVEVYRDDPSVEVGTFSLAGGLTATRRLAFPYQTFTAISADTEVMRYAVDTSKLIAAGCFGGSAASYGKCMEWGDADGNNLMPFWAYDPDEGDIGNWNTSQTFYYIRPQHTLSANSSGYVYLYMNPSWSSPSSHWKTGLAGSNGFFEHFSTDASDLADFLSKYTLWEKDPVASTCTITVSGSCLNFTTPASGTHGVATKMTGGFKIQNFLAYFFFKTRPGIGVQVGMVNEEGIAGSDPDWFVTDRDVLGQYGFSTSKDGSISWLDKIPEVGRSMVEFHKYGAKYLKLMAKDQPSGEPDEPRQCNEDTNDVDHKICVGSHGASQTVQLDAILVIPRLQYEPYLDSPDVTYEKVGAIFGNGHFNEATTGQPWYHELAWTEPGSAIKLKWCPDLQAQLTKNPAAAIQAKVRLPSAITSNTSLYCYFDMPGCTGSPPDMVPLDVFKKGVGDEEWRWLDMSTVAALTEKAGGSWSVVDAADPIATQGPVGNVGGQAGRLWDRFHTVVKWDTNSYYHFACVPLWEYHGGGWPIPYTAVMVSHSTTPTGKARFLYWMHNKIAGQLHGWWPAMARAYTYESTKYMALSWAFNGCRMSYTTDPSSPDGWNWIDYTFWDSSAVQTWMPGCSGLMWGNFYLHSDNYWYITLSGWYGWSGAHVHYCKTAKPPHLWSSNSDFTNPVDMLNYQYCEDDDLAYDAGTGKYFYCSVTQDGAVKYWTSSSFPGNPTSWGSSNSFTVTGDCPFDHATLGRGSPRVLEDDSGDWHHYFHTQPNSTVPVGFQNRWIPNWPVVAKAGGDPTGSYAFANTNKKYKQSTTSGVQCSYISAAEKRNGKITLLTGLGRTSTAGRVGVIFRLDDSAGTGYAAMLDQETDGHSYIKLFKVSNSWATWTQLGSTVELPWIYGWFERGWPIRLMVTFYCESIDVYYSLWGSSWVKAISYALDGPTMYASGHYGFVSVNGIAYFDESRYEDWTKNPAYVSSAGQYVVFGEAELDGVGSLEADTLRTRNVVADASGVGELVAASQANWKGIADLTGSGEIASDPTAIYSPALSLGGVGLVGADLTATYGVALALDGIGLVTAALKRVRPGAGAMDGVGSLASAIEITKDMIALLTGEGTVISDPTADFQPKAVIDGVGILTGAPAKTMFFLGTMTGVGDITALTKITKLVIANLSGEGTVDSLGRRIRFGVGQLDGVGTIVALGGFDATVEALLEGVGAIVAGTKVTFQIAADLASASDVTANFIRTRLGAGLLSGTGFLTGTPFRLLPASGLFTGVCDLSGFTRLTLPTSGLLTGSGLISADGLIIDKVFVSAVLDGTGTLIGVPWRIRPVAGVLDGAGTLYGLNQIYKGIQGLLTGSGLISGDIELTKELLAALQGAGTIDAKSICSWVIPVTLDGVGTVTAVATLILLEAPFELLLLVQPISTVGLDLKTIKTVGSKIKPIQTVDLSARIVEGG